MLVDFEPKEFLRDVKEALLVALEPIEREMHELRQVLEDVKHEAELSSAVADSQVVELAGKVAALHKWVGMLEERERVPGPAGPQGEKGADGADGAPGSDGPAGADGKDGANGIDGKDGSDGREGIDGKEGVAGRDGLPGVPGRDGKDGAKGVDGKDGANGINGKDGADGRDGLGFDDLRFKRVGDREFVLIFERGERKEEFAFSIPCMIYKGVHQAGASYLEGDVVTRTGCLWAAKTDTDETPGDGATNWQMAAKKGRDGKDGSPGATGPQGQKGEPGRDGKDLTQLGPDGSKWR